MTALFYLVMWLINLAAPYGVWFNTGAIRDIIFYTLRVSW